MKFCSNNNFTLPKQSQRSRFILQDGSRSLGLFWKEKTLSYNRINTVVEFANSIGQDKAALNLHSLNSHYVIVSKKYFLEFLQMSILLPAVYALGVMMSQFHVCYFVLESKF